MNPTDEQTTTAPAIRQSSDKKKIAPAIRQSSDKKKIIPVPQMKNINPTTEQTTNEQTTNEQTTNEQTIAHAIRQSSNKKKNSRKTKTDNINQTEYEYLQISKINNSIYLGSVEHPYIDSDDFKNLNIDVIINCASEVRYPSQNKYVIENFPIVDGDSVSMLSYMDAAVEKINYYVTNDKKIYLHCAKGISRSPAILISYLMLYKHFSYDTAFDLVKALRPIIEIDSEFENQLRCMEQ